jgi:hypothetical protein
MTIEIWFMHTIPLPKRNLTNCTKTIVKENTKMTRKIGWGGRRYISSCPDLNNQTQKPQKRK